MLIALSGASAAMLVEDKSNSTAQLDMTVSRIGTSSTGAKPITKQAAASTNIGIRILRDDS